MFLEPDVSGGMMLSNSELFNYINDSQLLFREIQRAVKVLDEYDEKRQVAATRIQAFYRGYLSRQKQAKAIVNKPNQIFVRGLRGKPITLNVSEGTTVQEFKSKVEAKTGIPPELQRLIFGLKQLEDVNKDGKTLQDYGLRHESTVDLVLRLGGSGKAQKVKPNKPKKVKKNKVRFFKAFSFLDTSVQISLSRYDILLIFFFWTPVSKSLSISDVAFSLCVFIQKDNSAGKKTAGREASDLVVAQGKKKTSQFQAQLVIKFQREYFAEHGGPASPDDFPSYLAKVQNYVEKKIAAIVTVKKTLDPKAKTVADIQAMLKTTAIASAGGGSLDLAEIVVDESASLESQHDQTVQMFKCGTGWILTARALAGRIYKKYQEQQPGGKVATEKIAQHFGVNGREVRRAIKLGKLLAVIPALLLAEHHGQSAKFIDIHHDLILEVFNGISDADAKAALQTCHVVTRQPAPSAAVSALPAPAPAPPAPASEAAAAHGGGRASSAYVNFDDMHSELDEIAEQG